MDIPLRYRGPYYASNHGPVTKEEPQNDQSKSDNPVKSEQQSEQL